MCAAHVPQLLDAVVVLERVSKGNHALVTTSWITFQAVKCRVRAGRTVVTAQKHDVPQRRASLTPRTIIVSVRGNDA